MNHPLVNPGRFEEEPMEFRAHPLIALLMAHGSRAGEDSLW